MTLTKYYDRPLWRRALCHLFPFCVALCVGALSIMTLDRADPVTISWGRVIPPIVSPGQNVSFHYGSIRHQDYGGYLSRWIVDVHGIIYHLTDADVSGDKLPLESEGEVIKEFTVPCGISVGEATYYSEAHLFSKWNLMQRWWPLDRVIHYPFVVEQGSSNEKCGFSTNGTQGVQGVQGIQGVQGPQGPPGANASDSK